MVHRRSIVTLGLLGLGLLASLPACADDQPEQIIGPAPTMTCCWGNAPEHPGPSTAWPVQISLPPSAAVARTRGDWINPGRQD